MLARSGEVLLSDMHSVDARNVIDIVVGGEHVAGPSSMGGRVGDGSDVGNLVARFSLS